MPSHTSTSSLEDDYYYSSPSQRLPSQQKPNPPHHHQTPLASAAQHRYNSSITSARSSSPAQSLRKAAVTPIAVPSFSAFRSQLPSANGLKRPPPSQLQQRSPRAASFSISEQPSPRLVAPDQRPVSIAGPARHPGGLGDTTHPPQTEEEDIRPIDRSSFTAPTSHYGTSASIDSRIASTNPSSGFSSPRRLSTTHRAKYAHGQYPSYASQQSQPGTNLHEYHFKESAPMTAAQQAPLMTFQLDGSQRAIPHDSLDPGSGDPRPKSPASRFGSFFGWKSPQQKSDLDSSPTTTFSERSQSPMPSPRLVKTLPVDGHVGQARLTPPGLDVYKANSLGNYFDNPETPLLLGNETSNAHVKELERELSHISQELAGSIRREMELEDELERARAEYPSAAHSDRRSSDYFSDSGASSTRYPIIDVDAKVEQLERQLRKVEQDKANLKVDMASRLQTELARRRDLEELVRHLEDQLDKRDSGADDQSKVEELESSLDETRRRLGQEKQSKQSFEELYAATREELEQFRNERDNLRDEVVPQLRARIEGLEAQAAESHALMYENTRIQQELGPRDSSGSFLEDRVSPLMRTGLKRSSSVAGKGGLRRAGSIKGGVEGGRQRSGSNPNTTDAFKEIEDQRDALHKALKLLISRYERQQKEHQRAIKKVTLAKEKSGLFPQSRKTPYSKEVAFLKEEVSTLRKRTEDALEQKWQYEKGLSGLKMDLDRAEQETRGLRILLQDNDGSSVSAYSDFDEADAADEKLKASISNAEKERDEARQVAQEYRQRAAGASGESAAQLLDSAKRMDDLADQLEAQVQSNIQLRDRLASAVAKGEYEQKESTRQIEEMQRRLAGMEDSVLAAQQHSETTLADHDAEVRRIEDAMSPRLQRLQISTPEPNKLSPVSPLLKKSPKLGNKLSEASLLEASRTQMLERKVKELEGLLKEAEDDMQTVVQRVTRSQIEVNELQMERDTALVQMRKLQNAIVAERQLAESLMRQNK